MTTAGKRIKKLDTLSRQYYRGMLNYLSTFFISEISMRELRQILLSQVEESSQKKLYPEAAYTDNPRQYAEVIAGKSEKYRACDYFLLISNIIMFSFMPAFVQATFSVLGIIDVANDHVFNAFSNAAELKDANLSYNFFAVLCFVLALYLMIFVIKRIFSLRWLPWAVYLLYIPAALISYFLIFLPAGKLGSAAQIYGRPELFIIIFILTAAIRFLLGRTLKRKVL